ncbi:MAG: bacteriohemerythrin [Desulfotignum sp.]|nr:bacteriohemerythrin [Desulfotignum sp.]MCF8125925.1 bacteriohemerythrin [Desulfotignum sp.]
MTATGLKIQWDPRFSVDIEEIDVHQKKMFDLFNELIELKQKKADAKVVANMISEINDYGKLYFATEEKILRKREYPDREFHARAHRRFVRNAISLRREIAEDINNLTMETILELRDWLVEHIETSDSLYVPFLRIHRYIEEVSKKN